jgi:hypothetical protein
MKENPKSDLPSASTANGLDRLEIYSLTARGLLIGVTLLLAFSIIAGLIG